MSMPRALQPVLLVATLFLIACGGAEAQGVGPEIGSTVPMDLALEDLDGNPLALVDVLKPGTPTLIEIWASWCENCEALQPQLDAVIERWGDDVQVVAVAVAVAQSQRRVRRHVEEHGHTYPYLWDGAGNAVRALNAATTSIVVLADADGTVVYTGVGGDQDLVGAVAQVMGR